MSSLLGPGSEDAFASWKKLTPFEFTKTGLSGPDLEAITTAINAILATQGNPLSQARDQISALLDKLPTMLTKQTPADAMSSIEGQVHTLLTQASMQIKSELLSQGALNNISEEQIEQVLDDARQSWSEEIMVQDHVNGLLNARPELKGETLFSLVQKEAKGKGVGAAPPEPKVGAGAPIAAPPPSSGDGGFVQGVIDQVNAWINNELQPPTSANLHDRELCGTIVQEAEGFIPDPNNVHQHDMVNLAANIILQDQDYSFAGADAATINMFETATYTQWIGAIEQFHINNSGNTPLASFGNDFVNQVQAFLNNLLNTPECSDEITWEVPRISFDNYFVDSSNANPTMRDLYMKFPGLSSGDLSQILTLFNVWNGGGNFPTGLPPVTPADLVFQNFYIQAQAGGADGQMFQDLLNKMMADSSLNSNSGQNGLLTWLNNLTSTDDLYMLYPTTDQAGINQVYTILGGSAPSMTWLDTQYRYAAAAVANYQGQGNAAAAALMQSMATYLLSLGSSDSQKNSFVDWAAGMIISNNSLFTNGGPAQSDFENLSQTGTIALAASFTTPPGLAAAIVANIKNYLSQPQNPSDNVVWEVSRFIQGSYLDITKQDAYFQFPSLTNAQLTQLCAIGSLSVPTNMPTAMDQLLVNLTAYAGTLSGADAAMVKDLMTKITATQNSNSNVTTWLSSLTATDDLYILYPAASVTAVNQVYQYLNNTSGESEMDIQFRIAYGWLNSTPPPSSQDAALATALMNEIQQLGSTSSQSNLNQLQNWAALQIISGNSVYTAASAAGQTQFESLTWSGFVGDTMRRLGKAPPGVEQLFYSKIRDQMLSILKNNPSTDSLQSDMNVWLTNTMTAANDVWFQYPGISQDDVNFLYTQCCGVKAPAGPTVTDQALINAAAWLNSTPPLSPQDAALATDLINVIRSHGSNGGQAALNEIDFWAGNQLFTSPDYAAASAAGKLQFQQLTDTTFIATALQFQAASKNDPAGLALANQIINEIKNILGSNKFSSDPHLLFTKWVGGVFPVPVPANSRDIFFSFPGLSMADASVLYGMTVPPSTAPPQTAMDIDLAQIYNQLSQGSLSSADRAFLQNIFNAMTSAQAALQSDTSTATFFNWFNANFVQTTQPPTDIFWQYPAVSLKTIIQLYNSFNFPATNPTAADTEYSATYKWLQTPGISNADAVLANALMAKLQGIGSLGSVTSVNNWAAGVIASDFANYPGVTQGGKITFETITGASTSLANALEEALAWLHSETVGSQGYVLATMLVNEIRREIGDGDNMTTLDSWVNNLHPPGAQDFYMWFANAHPGNLPPLSQDELNMLYSIAQMGGNAPQLADMDKKFDSALIWVDGNGLTGTELATDFLSQIYKLGSLNGEQAEEAFKAVTAWGSNLIRGNSPDSPAYRDLSQAAKAAFERLVLQF